MINLSKVRAQHVNEVKKIERQNVLWTAIGSILPCICLSIWKKGIYFIELCVSAVWLTV